MSILLELIRNLNVFRFLQRSRSVDSGHAPEPHPTLPRPGARPTDVQPAPAHTAGATARPQDMNDRDMNEPAMAPAESDAAILTQDKQATTAGPAEKTAEETNEVPEVDEPATLHDQPDNNTWAHGIQPGDGPPRRKLSTRVPVGVLGLALIALWWSWPLWADVQRPFAVAARELGTEISLFLDTTKQAQPNDSAPNPNITAGHDTTSPPENEHSPHTSLQALAIVNPENLPRPIPPTSIEAASGEAASGEVTGGEDTGGENAATEATESVPGSEDAAAPDQVEQRPVVEPREDEGHEHATALEEASSPAEMNADEPTGDDAAGDDSPSDEITGDDSQSASPPGQDEPGQNEPVQDDSEQVPPEATADSTPEEPAEAPSESQPEAQVENQSRNQASAQAESFPEVGQTDPDGLTPFQVEVEVPTGSEDSGDERMVPAVMTQTQTQDDGSAAQAGAEAQTDLILLPTATPVPDPARLQFQAAQLPRVEVISAQGEPFTPTPEPSPTITPSPTPTPFTSISGRGRLWSTFTPNPAPDNDHYWIGNPFAGVSANRSASPSYQFGSTAGDRYRPHHGIDISNPTGTPVRAGVVGEVVHAGLDDPELLGPYNDFYGNTVVILLDQRLPVAGGELDVFVLYAHLSEVRTTVGERVGPDDIVGLVGMTGIAIGPHLHVEVRLGANTYDHSVNPYLWLEPAANSGTVAVRILTAEGHTWAGTRVSIARFDGGAAVWARQIETYLDTENIGPDPAWGENGAMGDVPAGHYYLIANIEGENIRQEFTVNAGETTFIEVRTQQ